jgi:hypothetical protein
MRLHVKNLTLLLSIFLFFTGCSSGNNAEYKFSENRIADIAILKIRMENNDLEITHLITHNRKLNPSSKHFQKLISSNQEKISELKSRKEALLNELNVIHEIEREYQSKKCGSHEKTDLVFLVSKLNISADMSDIVK